MYSDLVTIELETPSYTLISVEPTLTLHGVEYDSSLAAAEFEPSSLSFHYRWDNAKTMRVGVPANAPAGTHYITWRIYDL